VVSFEDVRQAAERLRGIAHRTPVASSRTLDERLGARLFLKCENLQRAGAFKFRGAYNAVAKLSDPERARGVLTYSSGNHAQATALACRLLGAQATIVMPENAPAAKRRATEGYGARIVGYDPAREKREEVAERLRSEGDPVLIPPYDHADVIAGQGTAAKELLEDTGPLELLLVCCGGGGLLAGSALAARALAPGCRVIGVEPELEIDVEVEFFEDGKGINTLAEIPGGDLAGQIVMVGAHLDSWHSGTGATDNGGNCGVVMEAMRILHACGLKPRRTVVAALWSGEEQGFLGSRDYITRHFATRPEPTDPEQLALPTWARETTWPIHSSRPSPLAKASFAPAAAATSLGRGS